MGGAPDISRPAPAGGRGPKTLAEWLEADGALEPGQVAALGAAVATELAQVHERGKVVGAVRPDSIVIDHGPETAHLAAAGWRSGLYRSPEQIEGASPTGASDVYSLGVVLLHALSGLAPPPNGRAATPADFPTALSSVPGHLDRRWQWVLQGMTTRSPDLRLSAALAAAALLDLDRRHHRNPRTGVVPPAQGQTGVAAATAAAAVVATGARSASETTLEPVDHRSRLLRRPVAVAAVGLVLAVSAAGALTARSINSGSGSKDPDLVVVQQLASSDPTPTTIARSTTTTTPATGDESLALAPAEGDASSFGASLGGGGSTFVPLRLSLDQTSNTPQFALGSTSSDSPGSFSVPTPTVPLRPPTTLTPPTTHAPTTTTTKPPTTAPPTTAPPTTAPPTTAPPTTAPPTTAPPTTPPPPPTTVAPPPPTVPPTTVPLPLPDVTTTIPG